MADGIPARPHSAEPSCASVHALVVAGRWCTRWQRMMRHAGTPRRAASTRVNPVRHLRLLPHRHQGGRQAARHGGRRARRGAAPRGPVCSAVHKARLMPAQALVPDWFSRSLGFGDDDRRASLSTRPGARGGGGRSPVLGQTTWGWGGAGRAENRPELGEIATSRGAVCFAMIP